MTPKQKKALDQVIDELTSMPQNEFDELLEKHKDGDFATILKDMGALDILYPEDEKDEENRSN